MFRALRLDENESRKKPFLRYLNYIYIYIYTSVCIHRIYLHIYQCLHALMRPYQDVAIPIRVTKEHVRVGLSVKAMDAGGFRRRGRVTAVYKNGTVDVEVDDDGTNISRAKYVCVWCLCFCVSARDMRVRACLCVMHACVCVCVCVCVDVWSRICYTSRGTDVAH